MPHCKPKPCNAYRVSSYCEKPVFITGNLFFFTGSQFSLQGFPCKPFPSLLGIEVHRNRLHLFWFLPWCSLVQTDTTEPEKMSSPIKYPAYWWLDVSWIFPQNLAYSAKSLIGHKYQLSTPNQFSETKTQIRIFHPLLSDLLHVPR